MEVVDWTEFGDHRNSNMENITGGTVQDLHYMSLGPGCTTSARFREL